MPGAPTARHPEPAAPPRSRGRAVRRTGRPSPAGSAPRGSSIHANCIVPKAISTAISIQQQPTQNSAVRAPPATNAPVGRSRCLPWRMKNDSGDRQCRRHTDFSGVSWYRPAATATAPATRPAQGLALHRAVLPAVATQNMRGCPRRPTVRCTHRRRPPPAPPGHWRPPGRRGGRPATTAGNIIAAIIATHATRNATNDIVGCGSIDIPSPPMPALISPALTVDHHQPRPASISSATGSQMSLLPAAPRTSPALTLATTARFPRPTMAPFAGP